MVLCVPVLLGSSCFDVCVNKHYPSWKERLSRWFLTRDYLTRDWFQTWRIGFLVSLIFPDRVILRSFVPSWCHSLHLLSENDSCLAWGRGVASLPAPCLWFIGRRSRAFFLPSQWVYATDTSLGLWNLWKITNKFLCTLMDWNMGFSFYAVDVGNRKSEEPAVLRCLRKQVGKTSWRNQWPDLINRFSHFPELIGNNPRWYW